MDFLSQLRTWIEQPDLSTPIVDEPASFAEMDRIERRLYKVDAPTNIQTDFPDLDVVQRSFLPIMEDYLAQPNPEHILLFLASPGTGKTTAAVKFAEICTQNEAVKRILYAGPRTNFYQDVQNIAQSSEWYQWLPRQTGDDDKVETCIHANNINKWLARGYDAVDFCKQICGWDYFNHECVYMRQKKVSAKIVYGHHNHLSQGHPLQFDLVIGDEDPTPAFFNKWEIPADAIVPDKMQFSAYKELLVGLSALARSATSMSGDRLISALGGAEFVIGATKDFECEPDILTPDIRYSDQVDNVPYNHIWITAQILAREARLEKFMMQHIPRIILDRGNLILLLRKEIDWERFPPHVIWLDATANARIYQEVFGRPVQIVDARAKIKGKIYQVHDRLNGKNSMTENGGISKKGEQAMMVVDQIIARKGYENPAVITFQAAERDDLEKSGHFYASRGTNEYETCDAIFIVGTPQPPTAQIVEAAAMIFFRRDLDFKPFWVTLPIPNERGVGTFNYCENGEGRAYPASGFWLDKDLEAVLWSQREAEIIQAAHRVRPIRKDVDIWLMTNLPIWELPPTRLLSVGEALDAPPDVNVYTWGKALKDIDNLYRDKGAVFADDMIALGYDEKTTLKYINALLATGDWYTAYAMKRGRGRPKFQLERQH